MFHANGWGMPFAMTGLGAQHVVLRKIDGNEILRRVAEHGVTVMCAAPTVVNSTLAAALEWEGDVPGRDRVDRDPVGGEHGTAREVGLGPAVGVTQRPERTVGLALGDQRSAECR